MKPNLNIRGFHLDLDILLPTLCLLILGIIMVTSSSISLADRDFGEPFYYLYRQMSAIFIGLGLGVILLLIPTDYWFKLNWLFFLGVNESKVELTLGLGKKQFFDILKCFFTSNLQFVKTANLPKSLV